jgi:hypothetical protein
VCHGGGWESLLHEGGPASVLIFVPQYVTDVGLRFKWYTPCMIQNLRYVRTPPWELKMTEYSKHIAVIKVEV